MKIWTRRAFLAGGAAAAGAGAFAGITFLVPRHRIRGRIVGPSRELGHRLIEDDFPEPSETLDVPIAILGGGIAGLGAAWALERAGRNDFAVFELEDDPGGNARSGRNSTTGYPWGAHYIPLPNRDTKWVRLLLQDLGVLRGETFDERALCFDPHERVFLDGKWQGGLFPLEGASEEDLRQFRDFVEHVKALGRSGRFRIPVSLSTPDPELDRMTMDAYLRKNGWTSERLRWYAEYACRDDYGCSLQTTSAWAGLHYFAGREQAFPAEGSTPVLTWPEGNGWIVRRLVEKAGRRVKCGHAITRIVPGNDGVVIRMYRPESKTSVEVRCRAAICALPRFATRYLMEDWRSNPPDWLSRFTYAPWMVANLTVDRVPVGKGFSTAWDNVLYDSPSLGYVVATHQSLAVTPGRSVLTYYLPMAGADPSADRRAMLSPDWSEWRDRVVDDLSRAHPDIGSTVEQLDVMLWAHAMIRPVPGFVWGEDRARGAEPVGRVFFANSDLGGLPLFEEALTFGAEAAGRVLDLLGK